MLTRILQYSIGMTRSMEKIKHGRKLVLYLLGREGPVFSSCPAR
jgi:hypothetical protein